MPVALLYDWHLTFSLEIVALAQKNPFAGPWCIPRSRHFHLGVVTFFSRECLLAAFIRGDSLSW